MPSPHAAKASPAPDDRIRFTTYQGKQILLVDVLRCPAETVAEVLRKVPEVVSTQPLRSVLLFADFTGAAFNSEALRVFKETAVFDKPYIKKSAWIGAEAIPHEYIKTLTTYSFREFPTFKSREKALAWLVTD
jgi:hypothetical protein